MTSGLALALFRLLFSLIALAAIVVQFADLAAKGVLNPVNYFSYFTIESNLIRRGRAADRGRGLASGAIVGDGIGAWRRSRIPDDHLRRIRIVAVGH
jgi:uncharacterized membrane protein YfcA